MSARYFTPQNFKQSPRRFREHLADMLAACTVSSPDKPARVVLGNWAEWQAVLDPRKTGSNTYVHLATELVGKPGESDLMTGVYAIGVHDPRIDDWVGSKDSIALHDPQAAAAEVAAPLGKYCFAEMLRSRMEGFPAVSFHTKDDALRAIMDQWKDFLPGSKERQTVAFYDFNAPEPRLEVTSFPCSPEAGFSPVWRKQTLGHLPDNFNFGDVAFACAANYIVTSVDQLVKTVDDKCAELQAEMDEIRSRYAAFLPSTAPTAGNPYAAPEPEPEQPDRRAL